MRPSLHFLPTRPPCCSLWALSLSHTHRHSLSLLLALSLSLSLSIARSLSLSLSPTLCVHGPHGPTFGIDCRSTFHTESNRGGDKGSHRGSHRGGVHSVLTPATGYPKWLPLGRRERASRVQSTRCHASTPEGRWGLELLRPF